MIFSKLIFSLLPSLSFIPFSVFNTSALRPSACFLRVKETSYEMGSAFGAGYFVIIKFQHGIPLIMF
jgi:hypothetical protein